MKAIRRQNVYSTHTSKMASCTLLLLREIAKCSQVRQETSISITNYFQLNLLLVDDSIFFGVELPKSCGNITKSSSGWLTCCVARRGGGGGRGTPRKIGWGCANQIA